MPTEEELEQRRLDLHERELEIRERELHDRSRQRGNYLSMLPLPLAAAIASGAVTMWQLNQTQTQQNYEREIAAVRYYLDNRDQKFAFDTSGPQSAIEAVRMLKQMSVEGFNVVKCDLWNRAYLQIPPDQYPSYKNALEKVLFTGRKSGWFPFFGTSPEVLDRGAERCKDVPLIADAKPHASQASAKAAAAKGAAGAATSASPSVAPSKTFKIFFQAGTGRPKTLNGLMDETGQKELEAKGFEFASRGVATLTSGVHHAEIRYYGPEQEPMAKELKASLQKLLEADGLDFHLRPIGTIFPDLPKNDIEVLIPDAAAPK